MESQCNTVYIGTAFNGFLECGSRFTLIIFKNALDNSSLKLNFLQKKKQWTHISISPSNGASDSKDLHSYSSALYVFQK